MTCEALQRVDCEVLLVAMKAWFVEEGCHANGRWESGNAIEACSDLS